MTRGHSRTHPRAAAAQDKAKLRRPTTSALWRSLRFYLGSVAFGSLIIAIVQARGGPRRAPAPLGVACMTLRARALTRQFIRIVLAYIDRQTKGLQEGNLLLRIVMKVVQCCLWCFEKIVKYITRFAFIALALRGESFCASARTAMGLLISNAGQVWRLMLCM